MKRIFLVMVAVLICNFAQAENLGLFNNSMRSGYAADTVKGVGSDTLTFATPNTADKWYLSLRLDTTTSSTDDSFQVLGRDIPAYLGGHSTPYYQAKAMTPFTPVLWQVGTDSTYVTTEWITGFSGMGLINPAPNPPDSNYVPGAGECAEYIFKCNSATDSVAYIAEFKTKNND